MIRSRAFASDDGEYFATERPAKPVITPRDICAYGYSMSTLLNATTETQVLALRRRHHEVLLPNIARWADFRVLTGVRQLTSLVRQLTSLVRRRISLVRLRGVVACRAATIA